MNGDPDDGSTSHTADPTPTDFGSPVEHADLCEILGSTAITQFATDYGYDPGTPEQTDPGTCAQYPTRIEGTTEKETITILSTADIWTSSEDAEAAFGYWNNPDSNSYRLRLPFPEAEQESTLGEGWDEAVMVTDPEWAHGPQLKIMARSGEVIVFYHIAMSLKDSEEICSESVTSSCVIPPEIVGSWIETDLLTEALEKLRAESIISE